MAYITVEEVKEIRKSLKAKFGKKFKFSVARRDGGLAVAVSIMKGDVDFSELWADREVGEYGYGYKDVNRFHITKENYGEHATLFDQIDEIIRKAPANAENGSEWFDKSDAMTDYFHTAFYYDIKVGKWDRAYVKVA